MQEWEKVVITQVNCTSEQHSRWIYMCLMLLGKYSKPVVIMTDQEYSTKYLKDQVQESI